MKKLLFGLAVCSAVLFGLISCGGASSDSSEHVPEVVDLRNKEGGKVSKLRAASAREVNPEFKVEMLDKVDHFLGENGPDTAYSKWVFGKTETKYDFNDEEFAKIKDAVVVSDDDNGVKFTFNKPAGCPQDFTWINIHYLDDSGHKSTALDTSANDIDLSGLDTVELVYPLVDKTNPATRFWIQVCTDDYEAQLIYKVAATHGYGCVDSVQYDYSLRDYLEISDEGILSLLLTIPPVAKEGTLKHSIGFTFQTSSKPQYSEEAFNDNNRMKGVGMLNINEPASEKEVIAAKNGEVIDFKLDLEEYLSTFPFDKWEEMKEETKDYPYFWASFIYSYQVNVPGLEDYIFTTPWVISNVVENPLM